MADCLLTGLLLMGLLSLQYALNPPNLFTSYRTSCKKITYAGVSPFLHCSAQTLTRLAMVPDPNSDMGGSDDDDDMIGIPIEVLQEEWVNASKDLSKFDVQEALLSYLTHQVSGGLGDDDDNDMDGFSMGDAEVWKAEEAAVEEEEEEGEGEEGEGEEGGLRPQTEEKEGAAAATAAAGDDYMSALAAKVLQAKRRKVPPRAPTTTSSSSSSSSRRRSRKRSR
jgi:hypothetical protein